MQGILLISWLQCASFAAVWVVFTYSINALPDRAQYGPAIVKMPLDGIILRTYRYTLQGAGAEPGN